MSGWLGSHTKSAVLHVHSTTAETIHQKSVAFDPFYLMEFPVNIPSEGGLSYEKLVQIGPHFCLFVLNEFYSCTSERDALQTIALNHFAYGIYMVFLTWQEGGIYQKGMFCSSPWLVINACPYFLSSGRSSLWATI